LRLPLRFDPRLGIDLDCKAAAGMAHEFLDNLYVLSIPESAGLSRCGGRYATRSLCGFQRVMPLGG
jgi:hypothetical protein